MWQRRGLVLYQTSLGKRASYICVLEGIRHHLCCKVQVLSAKLSKGAVGSPTTHAAAGIGEGVFPFSFFLFFRSILKIFGHRGERRRCRQFASAHQLAFLSFDWRASACERLLLRLGVWVVLHRNWYRN